MPAKKPVDPNEKPQFERFIETARQIGADETDQGLDAIVKKVIGRGSQARSNGPGDK